MTTKTMMIAAFALATAGAMPAMAQMTPSTTSGQTGMMSGSGMDNGMDMMAAPKMTKSQKAAWKRCQAMPKARMMKNMSCMKMSKMQGMHHGAM